MEKSDNETLARLSAQGNESAFVELIRRHERQLAALIQYQLGNFDHAEDVLQETLLQACRDWPSARTEDCRAVASSDCSESLLRLS